MVIFRKLLHEFLRENGVDRREEFVHGLHLVDRAPKARCAGHAEGIPRKVTTHLADGRIFAFIFLLHEGVAADQLALFRIGGAWQELARLQIVYAFAEDPGVSLGGAAYHNAVATRLIEKGLGFFRGCPRRRCR